MASYAEINAVTRLLEACGDPCIVDLGSNQGEDAEWMTAVCKKRPKVVLVEADQQNFEHARVAAARFGATAIYGAIAAYTGNCDFWVCASPPDGRGSGSIRKPTGHVIEKPWYDFRLAKDQIPCYTLDYIFRQENLDHIDVLWVDIQGAERDMIEGGQEALKRTRFLFIEAEKRVLYEGQAIQGELLAMLPGWTVIGDFDFNLLLRNGNL
jgi:FkbM family methyltransferase